MIPIRITNIRFWMIMSAGTILVSLWLIFGVRPLFGIDFVGGSLIEIEADASKTSDIRAVLQNDLGLPATLQSTADDTIIIRTETINEEQHAAILDTLRERELLSGEEVRFEAVGPTIGQSLRRQSFIAVGMALLVMIGYLAYAFRNMKGLVAPWQLGVAAAYALFHDLLVMVAVFVIFGRVWGAAIDTLFVTALLAIMGYSVNDTIIIFDRMRSQWLRNRRMTLLESINVALQKTLTRSLNTSFTTIIVLLALLIFGGSSIRWFVAALLVGAVAGVYSTLFVAPPFLHLIATYGRKK